MKRSDPLLRPARSGLGALARLGVVVLAAGVLLEGMALALLTLAPGGFRSRAELQASLLSPGEDAAAVEPPAPDDPLPTHVLHPYLGFVFNRDLPGVFVNGHRVDAAVNEFGFLGPSPVAEPSRETAVVALTGGSVATELFLTSGDRLRESLAALPRFEGRPVELVSLAVDGMKQPQQLLAVAYLLSLGAHFDAVINLDGYNEVVLTAVDNDPMGIATSFPRNWRLYSHKRVEPEALARLASLFGARAAMDRARRRFSVAPCRVSSLCLAIWHIVERRLESERARAAAAVQEALQPEPDRALAQGFQERGPARSPGGRFQPEDPRGIADRVTLWSDASRQLARLCEANDIAYAHFLQPTQYVDGAKPLSDKERAVAFHPEGKYGRAARAAYPALIEARRTLAGEGIDAFDLTDAFAGESGTVYRDRCCHLTDAGYAHLATRMAEALTSRWSGAPKPPPR